MDLKRNIEDFDLTFIDVETTGLDAFGGDAICEIAALKTRKREVIDKFCSLINPKRVIPEEVYFIHRIDNQEVQDAPYFEEIADGLVSFLDNSVLCAHNIKFDLEFLNTELKRINYPPLSLAAIDILNIARKGVHLRKYNLGEVANFFQVEYNGQKHRALPDADVACKVFFKLNDIFREKGAKTLGDFIALST